MTLDTRRLAYAVSLTLLMALLLLSACTAPTASQPTGEEVQPVVTVFKSPT